MDKITEYCNIYDYALRVGSPKNNINFLKKEIEIHSNQIKEFKGVIPPYPYVEEVEILRCYLFGLIAQLIAISNK